MVSSSKAKISSVICCHPQCGWMQFHFSCRKHFGWNSVLHQTNPRHHCQKFLFNYFLIKETVSMWEQTGWKQDLRLNTTDGEWEIDLSMWIYLLTFLRNSLLNIFKNNSQRFGKRTFSNMTITMYIYKRVIR